MAVVIAATFKCGPLFRVTEITYLVPSRDNILKSSLYIFQAWVWWLW